MGGGRGEQERKKKENKRNEKISKTQRNRRPFPNKLKGINFQRNQLLFSKLLLRLGKFRTFYVEFLNPFYDPMGRIK